MIFFLLALGCTASTRSLEALTQAGYTEIKLEGHAWFACAEEDVFATAFKAKGPTGVPAEGAVCCGTLKGCTIRQ